MKEREAMISQEEQGKALARMEIAEEIIRFACGNEESYIKQLWQIFNQILADCGFNYPAAITTLIANLHNSGAIYLEDKE